MIRSLSVQQILLAACLPACLASQQVASRGLPLDLVAVVSPDDGGPERINGTIAVGPSGLMAFTLGFDSGDRLVTILDAQKRLRAHVVRRGSGPGEFTGVLALKFVDSLLYVAGAGQVSAFSLGGRHLWSRAVPPLQLMVAADRDSIDLLDARFFADGRGVGSVYRRSIVRAGSDRLLLNGAEVTLRRLARNADDSTRYPRLGIAPSSRGTAVANAQTSAVLFFGTDGRLRDTLVRPRGIRRRSPAEIERDARAAEQSARRPYKLPDGRSVTLPFDAAAERRRLRGPQPYFNARLGGFHHDAERGLTYFVESRGDSTMISRFGPQRNAVQSAMLACQSQEAVSAIAGAYLLLGCASEEDGDVIPTLRLYRLR